MHQEGPLNAKIVFQKKKKILPLTFDIKNCTVTLLKIFVKFFSTNEKTFIYL